MKVKINMDSFVKKIKLKVVPTAKDLYLKSPSIVKNKIIKK